MRRILAVCLVLVMASESLAGWGSGYFVPPPAVVGNWEGTNMDGWNTNNGSVAIPGLTDGVTLGTGSLGVVGQPYEHFNNGVSQGTWQDTWNQYAKKDFGNMWQGTPFANATTFTVDVTLIASQWTMDAGEWINPLSDLVLAGNGSGGWWDQYNVSGTHNWNPSEGDVTFHITVPLRAQGADATYEVFSLVSNQSSIAGITGYGLIYLDNAWIIPEPATMGLLGLGGLALLRRKK
jgi:hypothetical protein